MTNPTLHKLYRVSPIAANPTLRNQVVSVTGFRGATSWDRPRVEVKLVSVDGSLSDAYLVAPHILIAL